MVGRLGEGVSVSATLLGRLDEAEQRLKAGLNSYASLAPGLVVPTAWSDLALTLLPSEPETRQRAWGAALIGIAEAQAQQFPETLFWDFDYLAASLLRETEGVSALETLASDIIALQSQYGKSSQIAFRYAHDFIYGFDWARWVAKSPALRAPYGPFSAVFISYLAQRGHELVTLIARNDTKYPPLPPGVARNPFGFSRALEDEKRLFKVLAACDEIPLVAWRVDAKPRWDAPFADLRRSRAAVLGLAAQDTP